MEKTRKMKPMAPNPKPKGPERRMESRMPSQETIDKNSTKGRMGEGKVDVVGTVVKGAVKAAKKMGESMKRIVDISTNRTTKVRLENAKRAAEIQAPQSMGGSRLGLPTARGPVKTPTKYKAHKTVKSGRLKK